MDFARSYWVSRIIDRIHFTFLLGTYFDVHLGGVLRLWSFQFLYINFIHSRGTVQNIYGMFLLLFIYHSQQSMFLARIYASVCSQYVAT